MPRLRPGRNQLNIINVSDGVIKEFEAMRKGKGAGEKDIPRWELFERIFREWKDSQAQRSRKILAEIEVPDVPLDAEGRIIRKPKRRTA